MLMGNRGARVSDVLGRSGLETLMFAGVVAMSLVLGACSSMPLPGLTTQGQGSSVQIPDSRNEPVTQNSNSGDGAAVQTLPQAPFDLGEVIAEGRDVYREFWGMTPEGYFIVQDFYRVGKIKRTDPFIMVNLAEAKTWILDEGTVAQQYEALVRSNVGFEGAYVQWHTNGSKAIEGFFENRLPQKQWALWYENGQLMLQEELVDGVRNGLTKGWHDNGKPAGQGMYVDGVRQGEWTVWYGNGVKLQEGLYKDGQQDGPWTYWYDNGKRKEAGDFVAGTRVGQWTWWDREGSMVREAEYSPDGGMIGGGGVGSGMIQPRSF